MAATPSIGGGQCVPVASPMAYQAVPASQGPISLGPAGGAPGDYLHHLIIVPAATSGVGTVSIADGVNAPIVVFNGGALADQKTFTVLMHMKSVIGAWKITNGASVSVIAVGSFT